MSLFLAKKQEDNNQKKVRDLLRLKENKKCFDCPTKSPAFVNTTIQTFICSRCSGLVREVGHRVKAVSASKFSGTELLALKKGGNGIALKIWLSNYSTHDAPEPEADGDVRAFMKQKYYECKWLDRALLQSHKEEVRSLIAKSFTEDGLPIVTKSRTRMIPGFSRVPLIADNEMNIMHDDEEEENVEFSALQQSEAVVSSAVVPEYSVSQSQSQSQPQPQPQPQPQSQPQSQPQPHHQPQFQFHNASAYPMYPTSPVCRTSMDSINSYSSSSQGGSVYSNRESQDMIRNDSYFINNTGINTNRQSMESSHYPSSNTSSVLSAEEIAERCRSSIDSNTASELYQQKETSFVPESLQTVVAAEKPLPSTSIQVPNKGMIYQQQQHLSQYQLKSPTLVNFGNNIQSPSIQHGNHASASASLRVTPSTSNPITKPSRPPMATAVPPSASIFDGILSDLAGLKLEKTVRRATYTGGMLSPVTPVAAVSSPLEPSKSSPQIENKERPASMFNADFFSQLNKATAENKSPKNDPYAALRGIPASVTIAIADSAAADKLETMKDEDRNTSSSEDDDDEDPWQEFCSSSSTDGNVDNFLEPQQVIQPVHEESKPVTNVISIDLFSDLDPRSMFKRF